VNLPEPRNARRGLALTAGLRDDKPAHEVRRESPGA
jgi:hypothetical protein